MPDISLISDDSLDCVAFCVVECVFVIIIQLGSTSDMIQQVLMRLQPKINDDLKVEIRKGSWGIRTGTGMGIETF